MSEAAAPQRLSSLDTIRGVAVMGILLLNIVSFAMPGAAYFNPRGFGGWQGADLGAWAVNAVFFDGRMRGLFSFLFGASMLLVIERAEASDRDPALAHQLRMVWLLVFGLIHLWLIWDGDILALYAIVGMIAYAFRNTRISGLLALGAMLAMLGWFVEAQPFFALHDPSLTPARHARLVHDLTQTFGTPTAQEIAADIARHRSGYGAILAMRFAEYPLGPVPLLAYYGPETLAYMLFGMAGLRSGMLRGEWPRRRYWRWLIVSWSIALPVYAALGWAQLRAAFALDWVLLAQILAVPVRPLMIAGWVALILLLVRPGGALTTRVAAAGRMAFSNYLLTSIACTTLFYGYGLGWFGALSRWQLYPIVALVWLMMLAWSKPWLAHFRYGPLEWLWRSLARGRIESIRGAAAA